MVVQDNSAAVLQTARPALLAPTPTSGPNSTIAPANNETALMTQEDLMVAVATNMASLTSRTSMSVIIVGGVVCRFVVSSISDELPLNELSHVLKGV